MTRQEKTSLYVPLEAAEFEDLSLLATADGREVEEYASVALKDHVYGKSQRLAILRDGQEKTEKDKLSSEQEES